MSESIRVGKYMTAEPLGCDPEVYEILGRDGSSLGYAEWYPKWRRFVFCPDNYVVLSSDCCAAMAEFLSEQSPSIGRKARARPVRRARPKMR